MAGDGGRAQGEARQTQVAIAAGECSRGLWRRLQREEREMDRVRRRRGEMRAELKLQRARTQCGNGGRGTGDGGWAQGAAADRYGRVQQGNVAEAAEGGEGDGQGKEVAG